VAGSSSGAGIVVRNLTKRFGAVMAVDDLSFEIGPGRVTGFLGPKGHGTNCLPS
jgi:ABC-2 type transport system ATP-binding protein